MNLAQVSEIIDRYGADKTASLAILQDIQATYNYLPREALQEVARRLNVPISEIYRLATFFRAFSLHPKGEYVIKVCLGTACHVRGGPGILDTLERTIGIRAGSTREDNKFTLEAVRCVGACALGPIVLVNEEPHGGMTKDKAVKLIQELTAKGTPAPEEKVSAAAASRPPVDLSAVPPKGS